MGDGRRAPGLAAVALIAVTALGCGGDGGETTRSDAPVAAGRVSAVTEADFNERVLEAEQPVVVFFFARWSGPDRLLAPTVDEVAAEKRNVRFVKLDVDRSPAVAGRYEVMSVPTLMLFRDGKRVTWIVGNVPKRQIHEKIDSALR